MKDWEEDPFGELKYIIVESIIQFNDKYAKEKISLDSICEFVDRFIEEKNKAPNFSEDP